MRKRSRAEWAEIIAELDKSGESVAVFSRGRGLKPKSVSWWRWKLRQDAEQSGESSRRCREVSPEVSPFLPIVVAAGSAEPLRGAEPLTRVEAALPNGVVLRWEQRCDVSGLRDVATAFSEVPS